MSRAPLVRLDALLVKRGFADSPELARALIQSGVVLIDGVRMESAAAQVRPDRALSLARQDFPWVGRGALKLLGALRTFQVDPAEKSCADLGASTGGFTQVLIEQGARRVYAVDVGRGQLAWVLRKDPRVVVREGVNARHLQPLDEPIDLVVGDLSFISLRLILPAIQRILRPGGEAVILVKPQFEVRRTAVAAGGRVHSEDARHTAIAAVQQEASARHFSVLAGADCEVPGARARNVEYFLHLRAPIGVDEEDGVP